MNGLIRLLLNALAIIITAYFLPGVRLSGFPAAVAVAAVLAIVNLIIRPILLVLTLPLNILTLGLFTFVINALLVLLVSTVVPGFAVAGFGWALLFSLILTLVHWVLHAAFPVRA